ncbi:Adaptive-response sensory-kinase SasA [bioreactor metagenome]|uniref:Adaptive-response sensory-kinase SasA n=1 Tax=bioreactor metagenome TaxID=1076179 RepID=A0A644TR35_9ZZZZ|nr:ATP-binding protein [Negativicutes bacterium]
MLPKSLRGRLLAIMPIVVALPIIFAGYLMTISAEEALVNEKQQKLFGVARVLDQHLAGTYEDILRRGGVESADRQQKIIALNETLRDFTDQVATAYSGIGVGYYDKELDAIVTYGPSSVYEDKVGLPIGQTHEGRIVMEGGLPRVQEGNLVRGSIMNAMYPIIRNEKVIGYIWANELTSDIDIQLTTMKRNTYIIVILGLFLAIGGIIISIEHITDGIGKVKKGLAEIKKNLNYQMHPLAGELGEIVNALNDMASSLAAQKKMEKQLHAAERLTAIGEVAAGLAHEIRNPLMAVKGFAELLEENLTEKEKAEYLNIIIQETDRMNRLIEQLLCFSRPTITEMRLVNVNEVLENTLLLTATPARHNHTTISCQLQPDIPMVLVNGEQLKQVYLNLVVNAIQAISDQGNINIISRYDSESGFVVVEIEDNGSGIEANHFPHIFDPFFTTKESGTGLGLTIVYRMVESWGGVIEVNSVLGKGSRFTLFFPVFEE